MINTILVIDDTKDIEEILTYNIFDYIIKPLHHVNRLILVNKINNATKCRNTMLDLKKAHKQIGNSSKPYIK